MNAIQIQEFRNRLLAERASTADAVRRARSSSATTDSVSDPSDETDIVVQNQERTLLCTLDETRSLRLRAIEDAIERIDQGEYGVCKRCEDDISVKRLAAVPWTTLCIECQAELEHSTAIRSADSFNRLDTEYVNELCA